MMNTISAFSSEEYSYTISTNVKKSFQKISNSTYSKDGNKVGKKFINSAGFKVNISMKKENEMYQFIVDAIIECEKRKISGYYPLIIEKVKKMYDIVVSPAYLSNIKKRMGANNERN
jgi:hypothetical protein